MKNLFRRIFMEFSKIATEMNTRIENGDQETVEIELDHGEVVNCAIMIVLTVNEKDYIVLLPLDKNGQNHDGNVWFYEFIWDGSDKEPELGYISDDAEYEAVSEAFDLYLDDVEFDELVELPEEGLDGEE
ncbi:hypothetical protein bhn_I1314 [Butyrivibrio hungatei]|uniref:DUF1292 domain-containing protein n=2 Tax=Butyrivibrio hungatei TaxID=185008 RepID=A0A1D9P166_9FIRM|nr:hypothetical protein bhn_I1314 [Butyrivibrio hungatei]